MKGKTAPEKAERDSVTDRRAQSVGVARGNRLALIETNDMLNAEPWKVLRTLSM